MRCASYIAVLLAPLAIAGLGAGCGGEDKVDGIFTPAEWGRIQTLSPLPAVPPDPTNAVADDPRAAALGQMLFSEKGYSGALIVGDDGTNGGLGMAGQAGLVSCASCHLQTAHFDDARSMPNQTSLAVDWTTRNTPTLINAAFYQWFFWDGHADTLWSQALGPSEAPNEMAGSRLGIAHVLFDKYRAEYDAVFEPDLDAALDPMAMDAARFPPNGGPGDAAWDSMSPADQMIVSRIYANFGKSLAAYQRLLVDRDAPFDRYVAGDFSAIPSAAKRGLALFVGRAGCVECHSGPFLTDQQFHNVGVPQRGVHVPAVDRGRVDAIATILADPFNGAGAFSDDPVAGSARLDGLAPTDDLIGTFRTKSLREISLTAPYTHAGAMATLRDAVVLYDMGGGGSGFSGTLDRRIHPLNLTDREIDDLVAFLGTLSGDGPPAALLLDTSRP